MKRLLALIPAALIATSAFAQTAPEASYKDLWCGIAFGTAGTEAPNAPPEEIKAARDAGANATEEQLQIISQDDMIQQFITGGAGLIEGATAAYKEAGFTDEAFATVKTELEPKVKDQVTGGAEAEFSFEDCFALLPVPAEPAAAPAQ